MQSDFAKCILQGGWMVTAVKHGLPRTMINNSPFYITTNKVPDFGDDDDNIRRRIKIFRTKSLHHTMPGVDRWMYDHAMDCVAWIAEELTLNHHLIPAHELWYEYEQPLTISGNDGESLFNKDKLTQITSNDVRDVASDNDHDKPMIHESFGVEFRRRRLRQRRTARQLPPSTDESSEDEIAMPSQLRRSDDTVESNDGDDGHDGDNGDDGDNGHEGDDDHEGGDEHEGDDEHDGDDGHDGDESNDQQAKFPAAVNEGASTSCSYMRNTCEPHGGWKLNDVDYMAKVACLLRYEMKHAVQKAHVHSFLAKLREAQRMRSITDKRFWTVADPKIDAWMLLTGSNRDAFDLSLFVRRQSNILPALQQLRKKTNVLVLRSRCPVAKEIDHQRRQEAGANTESEDEVPSQSYWTTIKNWRPW